eukprot:Em0007g1530a
MAKLLHRLMERNAQYWWTTECLRAFDKLKSCLVSEPILAFPDFTRPFILDTDASDIGIGAVLSQIHDDGSEHVVSYASCVLSKPERNYCVTRRELLAVVTFVQHFRPYLLGPEFTRSYNQSQCIEMAGNVSWGRLHDGLNSCRSIILPSFTEQGKRLRDDDVKGKILETRHLVQIWDQLLIQGGILYRRFVKHHSSMEYVLPVVVPRSKKKGILEELHAGVSGGHKGECKMLGRLKECYYWSGHYADVKSWCMTCDLCTTTNTAAPKQKAPMQTFAVGLPMQLVAVDIFSPLPKSQREAETVAQKLTEEMFFRFSPPEQLQDGNLSQSWLHRSAKSLTFASPEQHLIRDGRTSKGSKEQPKNPKHTGKSYGDKLQLEKIDDDTMVQAPLDLDLPARDVLQEDIPPAQELLDHDATARKQILEGYHRGLAGDHIGRDKTLVKITNNVKEWVKCCDVCQRTKRTFDHPAAQLHPVPSQSWKQIGIDIKFSPSVMKSNDVCWLATVSISSSIEIGPAQNAVANGISQCVSKGEFLKFLGLRLAMACEPRRGPISVYWETGSEAGAVYTGADFGSRFKMSRHRFQDIQNVFSFAPPHNDVHTSDEPWQGICSFIEDFNLTLKRNCIPGCHIVVDECMSSWNGADGEFVAEGMLIRLKLHANLKEWVPK